MYQDYLPIIIFTLLAVALIGLPLGLQYLLSPRTNKGGDKLMSYECREIPEENAWVKFNIRFYIIALVFLIFDVEVVFLFPWAVVYNSFVQEGNGFVAFMEMVMFVTILTVGLSLIHI